MENTIHKLDMLCPRCLRRWGDHEKRHDAAIECDDIGTGWNKHPRIKKLEDAAMVHRAAIQGAKAQLLKNQPIAAYAMLDEASRTEAY